VIKKYISRRHDPFRALADPTRRTILELLQKHESCPAGEIAERFPHISRPAVSRHLRVLRQAGFVTAEAIGREHRYRLNSKELSRLHREWFAQFTPLWEASLSALKKQVESGRSRKLNARRTSRATTNKKASARWRRA